MLSNEEFIRRSLELNLFYVRIMKEHAIFMEATFSPHYQSLAQQADYLKCEFTKLLTEIINLSDGVISPEILTSEELVTKFTCDAERTTEYHTGIRIDQEITSIEISLSQNISPIISPMLVDQVSYLNQKAIKATSVIVDYKSKLLQDMLSCKVFTFNHPLMIDHILKEASFYLKLLYQLQNRQAINIVRDIIEQEIFWNQSMAEHAKLIRSLVDPTEDILFETANRFGKVFDELTKQATTMTEQTTILPQLTNKAIMATANFRDFKYAATGDSLRCKIKVMGLPLLTDHALREANHYLRILNTFSGRLR
ncbi:DUF2935 domain-containing protein [Desulfosporosinus sp. SB140]|uniref:DUF2935 domain-containing protein n=1 Tax=Desulfosporosinus paludis TaxID=3115649 RepID=UPI00388DB66C